VLSTCCASTWAPVGKPCAVLYTPGTPPLHPDLVAFSVCARGGVVMLCATVVVVVSTTWLPCVVRKSHGVVLCSGCMGVCDLPAVHFLLCSCGELITLVLVGQPRCWQRQSYVCQGEDVWNVCGGRLRGARLPKRLSSYVLGGELTGRGFVSH
jgi:hypothetical protein